MASREPVRVLVVDDNASQRLALGAILGDLDVEIVEADSGRAALRRLLEHQFAVILLDINMPGLDGFETAGMIRERPRSEHTPIIFVTAFSDDAHAARGYSLGAVDYIMAPVQPNVLRAKVSVFIDLYRQADQIAHQREELRRYAARLQQLSHASLAIHSAPSVEAILRVVAEAGSRIIEAHQSAASAAPDGAEAVAVTFLSEKMTAERGAVDGRKPAAAIAVPPRQPVRYTQAELREAVAPPCELVAGVALRGWLAVPMAAQDGRAIGLLQLSDKREGDFNVEDESILVQLAHMAAIAIENTLGGEAREANRLKDEFLGVLSHELRTPLQAMLTWISLLKGGKSDAATTERGLEAIERSARTQAQLISDLLDVSRIIRGQLRIEPAPVELTGVIAEAIEVLAPAAAAKRVDIAFTPPSGSHRVFGDGPRLQQVVCNILSNAVKFTPAGGRVEVKLDGNEDLLRIEVRDTGSGIPPEFLPHVFERFRQAEGGSGRRHGGLGLGLAIARHLVELHDGTVRAANDAGGTGAVFTVTLPRAKPSPFATPVHGIVNAGQRAGEPELVRLDGLRVLLVEDHGETRESVSTALELYGAEVIAVDSAAAALATLDRTTPHVLISDLGMPDQDGYDLIRKIRAREVAHDKRLPAAALTAYVRAEERGGALLAGFDAHVSKPIEPAELVSLVHRLARRSVGV